jgi:hypothetical protein
MMREIIPSSRWITILLLIGLLALIIYGAVKGDPATIVILLALVMFFAIPAALLLMVNRRAANDRRHTTRSDDRPAQH